MKINQHIEMVIIFLKKEFSLNFHIDFVIENQKLKEQIELLTAQTTTLQFTITEKNIEMVTMTTIIYIFIFI